MVALATLGAASVGLTLLIPHLPGRTPWTLSAIVILVCNALTVAFALRRALAGGPERRGWFLFAAAVTLSCLGNALWVSLPPTLGEASPLRMAAYAATPLSGVLMAAAVWNWPWSGARDHTLLSVLGAMVFCLSILLIPWIGGIWGHFLGGEPTYRILAVTLGSRFVLAGGLVAFLLAEDPRRMRGPLGWLALNCSVLFLQMASISHSLARLDLAARSLCLGLTPLISGALLMVAACPRPVEAPAGGKPMPHLVPGFLIHAPFLAVTTLIVVGIIGGDAPQPGVLLVFLLLTATLVLRQFLTQEQLAASHRDMEARVAARTRDLERMQDVVLLNERLNAVVVLGAGLVHDLNKGLGSILSAAEVLRMELERRMKVSGFAVEAIIEAVERSAVLSSRVMDFSRRLQEDGEVRDLRRELGALEGLLKLLVPGGCHLLLLPGQEPAPVRIHTEDLKQILVNLVANARDAMPEGGTIRVAIGKEAGTGETFLDVEDTGTGIPEAHHERVFDPFFTTKEPGSAMGLGLASVKILLEKVQGRVEIRSAEGTGTRFRLLFPAVASAH